MSTIQTRNKMDDKIHKNQFYFVANAQLFDSSESDKISPMSNMAVNIAAGFTFSSKSSDILTKQLEFLLMNIANIDSETSTFFLIDICKVGVKLSVNLLSTSGYNLTKFTQKTNDI